MQLRSQTQEYLKDRVFLLALLASLRPQLQLWLGLVSSPQLNTDRCFAVILKPNKAHTERDLFKCIYIYIWLDRQAGRLGIHVINVFGRWWMKPYSTQITQPTLSRIRDISNDNTEISWALFGICFSSRCAATDI
jgi:hypothetical protein